MTHQENAPISGDNGQTVPPSGKANRVGTDDFDTTDDEFMQLVAQVNTEAAATEDAQQTKQGESK